MHIVTDLRAEGTIETNLETKFVTDLTYSDRPTAEGTRRGVPPTVRAEDNTGFTAEAPLLATDVTHSDRVVLTICD